MINPIQEIPTFRLADFNARRLKRGAEAAWFEVIYEDGSEYIWMSARHIRLNIKSFGSHPELLKGLECYKQGQLVDAGKTNEVDRNA